MNSTKEIALRAAKALDDKKGIGIKLLEVADVTSIADHFLICTGSSNTHVKTLNGDLVANTPTLLFPPSLGGLTVGFHFSVLDSLNSQINHKCEKPSIPFIASGSRNCGSNIILDSVSESPL